MSTRDYTPLFAQLAGEYARHAPTSAAWHQRAAAYLVNGGSHALRLMEPFSPRIVSARGAWMADEDNNSILDFWQGHYANVLGHNPPVVTRALAEYFDRGLGLQTGMVERYQVEAAEIISRQTGQERVRFTTSGTLATLYSIMLARAYTGRELVMKVGGGWHGGHFWGLKGVGWHDGFEGVDSAGIPPAVTDEIVVTGFNNPEKLRENFRRWGDRLACFIVEPVVGTGGLMPATREYMALARELSRQYGVLLILDEVISGFRFRAGDAGALFGVKPDLLTLGKAIGGGMPVAAVAGRSDIMALAERRRPGGVKFSGGTYSGHPASMLASVTMLRHLVENEAEIYPTMAGTGSVVRQAVIQAFAAEGIYARFAGDRSQIIPHSSLHMLVLPYEQGLALETPEEVRNPEICDVTLSEKVLQLALLLEGVFTVHGLGCTTFAHGLADAQFLSQAVGRAARRIKPYL